MAKFLREKKVYSNGRIEDNGWWEIQGDRLVNCNGGWHDYIPNSDDEIVEVDDIKELDFSYLLNPNSTYGWIAPDGTFYGCSSYEHDMIARMVLKFDEGEWEAEERGYIKIFFDPIDFKPNWYSNLRITKKQRDELLIRGFEIDNWD